MSWKTWLVEVQQHSGMSDDRMREIEPDARAAFDAGISALAYAAISD